MLIAFLGTVAARSRTLGDWGFDPPLLFALGEAPFIVGWVLMINVPTLWWLRSKPGKQRPGLAAVAGWAGVAAGLLIGILELHQMYADNDWEDWGLAGISIPFALGQLALALCATRAYRLMPRGTPQKPWRASLENVSWVVVYGLLFLLTVPGWRGSWHTYGVGDGPHPVADLRDINTALVSYASTYGKGYPPNLKVLGPPPKGAQRTCLAADLVNEFLSGDLKKVYQYTYKPGTPHKPDKTGTGTAGCPEGFDTYTITASPRKFRYQRQGWSNYFTDESGIIRGPVNDRPATAQDPPLGG